MSAYRVFRSIVEHDSSSNVSAEWVWNFWVSLRDSRQSCEAPARNNRLQTLEALLVLMQTQLAMQFHRPEIRSAVLECIKTVTPEVLSHLRDHSTAVRDAARLCLHSSATTAVHQDMQQDITSLIAAGLAGLGPHFKASAIDALSRLVY